MHSIDEAEHQPTQSAFAGLFNKVNPNPNKSESTKNHIASSGTFSEAPPNTDLREEHCNEHGAYTSRIKFYSHYLVGGSFRTSCPGCELARVRGRTDIDLRDIEYRAKEQARRNRNGG